MQVKVGDKVLIQHAKSEVQSLFMVIYRCYRTYFSSD